MRRKTKGYTSPSAGIHIPVILKEDPFSERRLAVFYNLLAAINDVHTYVLPLYMCPHISNICTWLVSVEQWEAALRYSPHWTSVQKSIHEFSIIQIGFSYRRVKDWNMPSRKWQVLTGPPREIVFPSPCNLSLCCSPFQLIAHTSFSQSHGFAPWNSIHLFF